MNLLLIKLIKFIKLLKNILQNMIINSSAVDSKIKNKIGWQNRKPLKEIIKEMINKEMKVV